MRGWARAIACATWLLVPVAAGAAELPSPGLATARPFPWQDPGPFARPFLQLPFEGPEPVGRGVLEVNLRTLYSSSVVREESPRLSVDVLVETAEPGVFVRYGLPAGFELQLALPGAIDYGGFLGRPIKFVEGFFGAPNPLRAGRTPTVAHFRVLRADGAGLDWSGVGGSAGDPWIGVKRRVRVQDGWSPAISWRAALAFPTAPLPWGSGLFEAGAGLVAGLNIGATSVLLEADVLVPERRRIIADSLQAQPHFTIQLGVSRRFTDWLVGTVQASTHTSAVTGTGIGVVDGGTNYLLAGIALEPTPRTSIAFALVENVFHPSRGADFSGLLEFAWRR